MRRILRFVLLGLSVLFPGTGAIASLASFENFDLGGATSSWDIYYGDNYLPQFNFLTGTPGNPSTSAQPLAIVADVTTWQPWSPPMPRIGQSTGPVGPDNSIPGDRDYFYTFFGSINWSISGTVSAPLNTFAFQSLAVEGVEGALANVLLNGQAAEFSGFNSDTGVTLWTWSELNLPAGSTFTLAWNTGTHTGLDAFQVQMDAQTVPEPAVFVLAGVGMLGLWMRRKSRPKLRN